MKSAVNGYQQGDVVISLSDNLASRIDESIVRISNDCSAGETFTTQKLRKRLDDFGSVICASERLVMNAARGGMFPDLLVLQPQAFTWAAADAVRAMNVVIAFARTQALDLGITTDQAAAVGVVVFAISWEVLMNGRSLSINNVIPASSLEGKITTTTAAPCPTQSCKAGCRMIGAIAHCSTSCPTPTGTCSATSTPTQVTTTSVTPWTVSVNHLEPESTAPPYYARILPLGASIVWGKGSTSGDGFVSINSELGMLC